MTGTFQRSPDVVDNMLKAQRQGCLEKPTQIDFIFKNKAALLHYALLYNFDLIHSENLGNLFSYYNNNHLSLL